MLDYFVGQKSDKTLGGEGVRELKLISMCVK